MREAAAAAPAGAEKPWPGDTFGGRLSAPLAPSALDAAKAADPLIGLLLRSTTEDQPADGITAELRGWDPGGGAAPGIAYALHLPTGTGLTLALHVTTGAGGVRAGLSASGCADQRSSLGQGWGIAVSGRLSGTLEAVLDAAGVTVDGTQAGDGLRLAFLRDAQGAQDGQIIDFGNLEAGIEFGAGPDGEPHRRASAATRGGSVRMDLGVLADLVPALGPIPLDLAFDVAPGTGVTLSGSPALRVRLPVPLTVPGATFEGLDVVLRPNGDGCVLGLRVPIRASLPGTPVMLRFDGPGAELPLSFGADPLVGPAHVVPPEGAAVSFDLPVVSGSGFVTGQDGEYTGGLSASIPPLSAQAFAVLGLEQGSFLAMLSAAFPLPGIQVGFGFAITGIGGIVGVNRRLDRDGLLRAVSDGTAGALLFPTDAAAATRAAQSSLGAVFPPCRGAVVTGPIFQLSWLGDLATASMAAVTEISATPTLSILGKLTLGVPSPRAALILIQIVFAAHADPAEPSLLVVASLTGSHIAGVPLTGDACLLVRGGRDADFVLSAGGFHPAFPIPRGVPQLRRIGMDLSPLPWLEMRCEAYAAVTSAFAQFGARLEIAAELAKCGLRGQLSLDAIMGLDRPCFTVDARAGVALRVCGENLVGVALDLRIEGPGHWHVRGRGEVDLFLFSISFGFDTSWGPPPPAGRFADSARAPLLAALREPGAWIPKRAARSPVRLALTEDVERALTDGEIVDPYGSVEVRQRVVPLGETIDRLDGLPMPAPERWDLTAGRIGKGAASQTDLVDMFAQGQFHTLTDDERIGLRAFDEGKAGISLEMREGPGSQSVTWEPTPERTIYHHSLSTPLGEPEAPSLRLRREALVNVIASRSLHDLRWQAVPQDQKVTVAPAPPIVAVEAGTMSEVALPEGGGGAARMRDQVRALAADNVLLVEAWEVVR
ncbi:DUF6603 domain-containing protein [Actinocorallia aurea]